MFQTCSGRLFGGTAGGGICPEGVVWDTETGGAEGVWAEAERAKTNASNRLRRKIHLTLEDFAVQRLIYMVRNARERFGYSLNYGR
jgi:hypothetical protein